MNHALPEVVFHRGDVLAKVMKLKRLRQNEVARLAGHGPNTITGLIRGDVETDPIVLTDVLRVLEIDQKELDALVACMNGELPPERPHRLHNERREDRDPDWQEAMLYVQTLLSFPALQRMLVYNLIRGIEALLKR